MTVNRSCPVRMDNSFEKKVGLRHGKRADLLLHRRDRAAIELVVNKVNQVNRHGIPERTEVRGGSGLRSIANARA